MVEDKTILQQLWGKELVVTTGLGFQSQKKLKEFIEQLVKYHSVGPVSYTHLPAAGKKATIEFNKI